MYTRIRGFVSGAAVVLGCLVFAGVTPASAHMMGTMPQTQQAIVTTPYWCGSYWSSYPCNYGAAYSGGYTNTNYNGYGYQYGMNGYSSYPYYSSAYGQTYCSNAYYYNNPCYNNSYYTNGYSNTMPMMYNMYTPSSMYGGPGYSGYYPWQSGIY